MRLPDYIVEHIGIEARSVLDDLRKWTGEQVAAAIAEERKGFAELKAELDELRAQVKTLRGPAGPAGKDGEPGKDGLDGKDGAEGIPGRDGLPGLPGRDGAPGLNGKDGAPGEKGEKGDDGDLINKFTGVWTPGEYLKGATAQYDGSIFGCLEDTSDKPETSKAWRLLVKRGRDGKNGLNGKDGAPGPRGPMGAYKGID